MQATLLAFMGILLTTCETKKLESRIDDLEQSILKEERNVQNEL